MKRFNVTIEGVTPYMQHRMDDQKLEDWEKKRGFIIERDDVNKEDFIRAEYHSYKNDKGKYFIPAEHIESGMIAGGAFVKAKVGNSTRSMKNIVAGMFYVEPTQLVMDEQFTIDKRSAVNRNIKGRVIVVRPRWDKWQVSFELCIDNDTITKETARAILEYTSQYIGIGSFRPQHNGKFGRFKITKFEEIKSGGS